jgi:parallel beta-helix repeat protein
MSAQESFGSQLGSGATPPRAVQLSPGQNLNGYRIHAQVSQAPHAFTYVGIDRQDGSEVVIRLAKPDAESRDVVQREAQTLSRIRHPGLVRLLGTGSIVGAPYLVLAHEDGVTLGEVIASARGRIGQGAVQGFVLRVLDALEVVHGAGLVHCDLSPSNVLVRPDGAPVILDFAAAQNPAERDVVRSFVDVTPGYAAPELYSLDANIGPWTDLYSVAALAFSLLTGEVPPDARERTDARLLADLPPERCSAEFAAAIDDGLRLVPEARPLSVKAWRDRIAAAETPSDAPDGGSSLAEIVGQARDETIALPAQDDFPATIRVAVKETPAAESGTVPALVAPTADRTIGAQTPPARRGSSGGAGRVLLGLVVVAGLAAAGWYGWEYYRWWSKTEWIVDAAGNGDAATIGEVLPIARPGSVVRILSGIYRESLVVDGRLSLVGESIDEQPVMIIPSGGRCLLVTSGAGQVVGLTFEGGDGSGPCIDVTGGEFEVTGNTISGWKGTGLRLRDGATATVTDNQILDAEDVGILVESGSGGTIESNRIERSGKAGISVRGGSSPKVTANQIERSGQGGLIIAGGSTGGYSDNVILDSAASGIEVRGGSRPMVVENRIGTAGQAGIYVYEGASGRFAGNRVIGSHLSGIVVATGASPVFEGNEIRGSSEHGILVVDGAGGKLYQNVVKANKGYGIALGTASNAVLDNNVVEDNKDPQILQGEIQTGG